ncbi:MAG: hypothetical protein H6811_09740 [Phycisphaeraceae bacterium]|nr:hypothetical protein [Phycisphaeraceae bacterium]
MLGTRRNRSCRDGIAAFRSLAALVGASLGASVALAEDPPPPPPPPPVEVPVSPLYQTGDQTRMDHSPATINDYGCTLVTWTMFINQQISKAGIVDGNDRPIVYTPAQVNTLLNEYRFDYQDKSGAQKAVNGWGQPIDPGNGQLIGDPPTTAPGLNLGGLFAAVKQDTKARSKDNKPLTMDSFDSKGFDNGTDLNSDDYRETVIRRLRNGDSVPVRVADDSGNEGHSVLITSFHPADPNVQGSKDRWDIKDPYKDGNGKSSIWLDDSPYNNKIFSAEAAVLKKGGLVAPYTQPSPYWFDPNDLFDPLVNPDQFAPYYEVGSFPALPAPGTTALLAIGGVLASRRRR